MKHEKEYVEAVNFKASLEVDPLTSSSFKHHASFIIQIHQLAFLEHTHSVARKYFEFDYSLSICLPFVEWVKYNVLDVFLTLVQQGTVELG